MTKYEWPAHLQGPLSERKYALFPISELIPSQRSASSEADDGQRTFDKVLIKGVSVRMTLMHAEGCRLLLFAFRNGTRRELPIDTVTRPFEILEDSNEVPCGLNYEIMTKDELYYSGERGDVAVRHLGWDEGPFAVRLNAEREKVWKSTDETAFTSRLSKEEGKPVGDITVRVDEGKTKKCGSAVCNMNLTTSGVMRTMGASGRDGVGAAFTATRFRHLEFYIKLNKYERYTVPSGSRSVSERPLELFMAFDGPPPFELNTQGSTVCASITSMNVEVYYE
jgi:hypothetical protein